MMRNGGTMKAEHSLHTRASIAAVCECRFLLSCLVIATSSATTGPERKNRHSNCFQRRSLAKRPQFFSSRERSRDFFLTVWTFCGAETNFLQEHYLQ
mmetsp:Transcript_16724/g.30288  ORF Transcript_16724/g.30288 Transcript_16724/m.30288 type:complete len:97 (-) Transcript_16724:522-812(-)